MDEDTRSTGSQAFISLVGRAEAKGMLRRIYDRLGERKFPAAYEPASGDVANIIRAHSLDPEGLALAFSWSGSVSWGPGSLPWHEREMMNTVTSSANRCFY